MAVTKYLTKERQERKGLFSCAVHSDKEDMARRAALADAGAGAVCEAAGCREANVRKLREG